MAHRLTTLVFSHYNEKARWALDHCRVPYEERRYMPGFSQLAVLMATRGRGGNADRVSSRFSTPILVTNDGEAITDSTAIARFASEHREGGSDLFPNADVEALVEELGRDLGPYTRRVAYWHAFRSETALATMAKKNVSTGQALAFSMMRPLGTMLIKRSLKVDEASVQRALDKVKAVTTRMEERLDRHPYLAGDTFTAADLTFAALLAPALLVTPEEGYGAVFPSKEELRADAQDLVAETRASRAGKFALEMFRRHRRP